MGFLSNLSISRKIFAIPVVAMLFFSIYLVVTYRVAHENLDSIESVYNIDFQALIIAQNLLFDIERIDKGLTQAAMAGEQEDFDIALVQRNNFLDSIQALRNLPAPAEAVEIIEKGFIAYSEVAFPLSQSMVDGTADFSTLAEKSQGKNGIYESFKQILDSFIARRNKKFDDSFESIAYSAKKQTRSGLVAGFLMALFLLIIALPIALAIDRHMRNVIQSLKHIATEDDGDLTLRLSAHSRDEIGQLVHWFNQFIARLHKVISQLIAKFRSLEQLIVGIDEVAMRMGAAISDQKSDAKSAKTAVDAINKRVNDIADFSEQAAKAAEHSECVAVEASKNLTTAAEGVSVLAKDIERAQQVISSLAEDVQQVGSVLEVINNIAEQTNLLALNAAIEAARAGEQGRGFAVVADEVRNLAIKTQQSTHEIESTVLALKKAASEAVDVTRKSVVQANDKGEMAQSAGVDICSVTEDIKSINKLNKSIADVVQEQAGAIEQLVTVVGAMDLHANQAAKESGQLHAISRNLVDVADQVSSEVGIFKVARRNVESANS